MGDFSASGNHIEWVTDIDYLSWQKSLSEHWQTSLTLVENNSSEQGTATAFTRAQATAALQSHSPVLYTLYLADVKSRQWRARQPFTRQQSRAGLCGGVLAIV